MEVSSSLRLANFNKLEKKAYFMPFLMKKVRILKILSKKFLPKISIKQFSNAPLSLTVTTTRWTAFFNDTTHRSLRWIYRSAKIDWTKKNPIEYVVPPFPLKWGSEQLLMPSLLKENIASLLSPTWCIFLKNLQVSYLIVFFPLHNTN